MLNSQSNCTPKSRTVSADTILSALIMFSSDDDSDFSAVDLTHSRQKIGLTGIKL